MSVSIPDGHAIILRMRTRSTIADAIRACGFKIANVMLRIHSNDLVFAALKEYGSAADIVEGLKTDAAARRLALAWASPRYDQWLEPRPAPKKENT